MSSTKGARPETKYRGRRKLILLNLQYTTDIEQGLEDT